tara:strand:- start:443 stop:661 length:219 start_codon:yes stop_codon:yes gene_type:complete
MNFWEAHDIASEILRQKIILLTEEFDEKNKLGKKDYNKRLNNFLKLRVGRESNLITNTSIVKSVSSIINRNI